MSLTPRYGRYDFLRADPDAYALSLADAQALARLPRDAKAHILTYPTRALKYLLPEHRAIVVDSLRGTGQPDESGSPRPMGPDSLDSAQLPRTESMLVLVETLRAIEADADTLRQELNAAIDAQDRDALKRLLADNIRSSWYLSHVIVPFVEEYAPVLEDLGVDPQRVLVQANSFRRQPQAAELAPLPAAADPDRAQDSASAPAFAPDPAPAPATESAPPPASPQPSDRSRTTAIRVGKTLMDADRLAAMLTGFVAPPTSATPRLIGHYLTLVEVMAQIEGAIRSDEGPTVFYQGAGSILNAFQNGAWAHPLARVFEQAGRHRATLAATLAARQLNDDEWPAEVRDRVRADHALTRHTTNTAPAPTPNPAAVTGAPAAAPIPAPLSATRPEPPEPPAQAPRATEAPPAPAPAPPDPYAMAMPRPAAPRPTATPAPAPADATPPPRTFTRTPPRAGDPAPAPGPSRPRATSALSALRAAVARRAAIRRATKAPVATRLRSTPLQHIGRVAVLVVGTIGALTAVVWFHQTRFPALANAWAAYRHTLAPTMLETAGDQPVMVFMTLDAAYRRAYGSPAVFLRPGQHYRLVRITGDLAEITIRLNRQIRHVWVERALLRPVS